MAIISGPRDQDARNVSFPLHRHADDLSDDEWRLLELFYDPESVRYGVRLDVVLRSLVERDDVQILKGASGRRKKMLTVSGKVRLQPSELPSNSCFVGKPYQTAATVAELRSLVGSP